MKVEPVRSASHTEASEHKIAHGGERRESNPVDRADPRRDKPRDRRDSRWDDHRRARRAELVDAAVIAVGRHGAGVGMEEIAAAAGTSKTVVYRHFADRTDLHVAVCARVAGQLLPKLREAMGSSDDPRQMVAAAIETYLAFLEADPELYRFVVDGTSGATDSDPIGNLGHLVGDQAAALVAVALEQAGRDPAAAAPWGHGVVGMVRSAADWWLSADRPMIRSDLAAHLTDLAWAGLSGVVGPGAPGTTTAQPSSDQKSKEEA
jgi:AcrR family transcriptional regulator